jgi:hypothetical protein
VVTLELLEFLIREHLADPFPECVENGEDRMTAIARSAPIEGWGAGDLLRRGHWLH